MTLTRSLALTAALAFAALGTPATTTVSIIGSAGPGAFNPNPVTIALGDSVAWVNNDVTIHRIVLDNGSYDSGNINPGASSAATAALTASGTYHCTIHPTMTGTITVPAACTFSINPTSTSISSAVATGTVTVTAGASCAWTAVSNSSFITVLSGATGSGNGMVSYGVAANFSTSPRTGTITIAGQTFTVTQAGSTCAPITISPASMPNAILGVPYSVTITPSGGTAPYTFSIAIGGPPPGITLSAGGVISGTPADGRRIGGVHARRVRCRRLLRKSGLHADRPNARARSAADVDGAAGRGDNRSRVVERDEKDAAATIAGATVRAAC